MKKHHTYFPHYFFQAVMLLSTSCSATNGTDAFTLVGGTPGDATIKSMLSISKDSEVDFIKWDLMFDDNHAYALTVVYGTSQPNTLGFVGGGETKRITGTYAIEKTKNNSPFKEVYRLKSTDLPNNFLIAKINENVFHLLSSPGQLMVGNGGWSYSLTRKIPVDPGKILIASPADLTLVSRQVFDGRTPCQEIAAAHSEMNASPSCFKLKWRLILNRDPVTNRPTTCSIRNIVDNEPRDITGTWEIVKGTKDNPDVWIYKVSVGNLAEPVLFLVGDENVLFFIDRDGNPLAGNENFGFALNKVDQ